jgi:hypothetical protein
MRTPDMKFNKVHAAKTSDDAIAAIKAADASLTNMRAVGEQAEEVKAKLAKMNDEDRKLFGGIFATLNTSPDDARVKAREAFKKIRGAIINSFPDYSDDIFAEADSHKLAEILAATTELYNKFPQAFPVLKK